MHLIIRNVIWACGKIKFKAIVSTNFSSSDNVDQPQPPQPDSEQGPRAATVKQTIKRGLLCATVLAYFVYFSFAMAMNFQKAIPLLCITAFVCFCTSHALVKRKFGSRIAKSMHITRLKGCCSPLSRKLSMYVFNDKWILTKGSILSIKIVIQIVANSLNTCLRRSIQPKLLSWNINLNQANCLIPIYTIAFKWALGIAFRRCLAKH